MNPDSVAEALSRTNFSPVDVVIVVLYLSISLVIGLKVRRYAKDMTAYIGAGRAVGTWLGIATMLGTEMGLITVMYSAQKGFTGGFAAFHIAVIAGVATLLVGLSGFIVVPLRRMEVLTIPEFYGKRFDRKTRILGGIMLAFAGILNMGLFLKVGSMFIVGITGLSSSGTALPLIMIGLLVLVLVYTMCGGMISVILTDYIQFVVLSVGVLMVTFLAIGKLGWENIFLVVQDTMGEAGFNPVAEGSNFGWSYVIWMVISAGLVGAAVWPTAVARALTMKSTRAVRNNYTWSSISFTVRFMIPYFLGICAFVYIMSSPEALDLKNLFFPAEGSGEVPFDNLYAMPVFLGRLIPPVLIGVITAAMIAAFMSTHDSYFLCWSSVITQDVVAPLRKNGLSEKARVKLTRWIILCIGLYVLYWGLFYKGKDDIWDYMAVSGAIYFNGALAVLVAGIYWKKASSAGAFAALLAGFTAIFGLGPVQQLVGLQVLDETSGEWLQKLSGAQVGLLSVLLSFLAMVVCSLLFPDREVTNLTDEQSK
ncbi:MAG: sodium:solute symporter family protein [Verrucomicrobiales bacterium]|nr:sodium:solute symporter family protein [Verrucomicrobiales bacterium]